MNRAARIATAPFRGMKSLSRMVFGRGGSWFMWRMSGGRIDYRAYVGDGHESSVVMAPLLWIGRTFPEAPAAIWSLADDGQEEMDPKHDLIRLLQRPNAFYAGTLLWMATLYDWFLTGDAYWMKIRDRGGKVVELWWTPSVLVTPKGDENNFITHYEYRPNNEGIRVEPSEIVHFRYGLDPDNPKKGLSPLASVLREVFSDDEASNFSAALLKNMGVPGIVVSPEGDVAPGPDDVKATKAFISEAFTGDKRGEPLVMSGPTKVQQFGFNPQQMDLRTLRRIPEERVSAVTGVPAIVAGLGAGLDRSTFANMSEAREMAYESCLIPSQRILAEEVRFQLLVDFEPDPMQWRFGFDLSHVRVLQEDRNKEAERWNTMVAGGWARVAEARRAMELDTDDNDEVYLRSIAVVETDGTPQELPPAPGAGPEEPPPPPGTAAAGSPKLRGGQQRMQQRIIQALHRDSRRQVGLFQSALSDSLSSLGAKAEEAYLSLVGPLSTSVLNGKGMVNLAVSSTGRLQKMSDAELADRVVTAMGLNQFVDGPLRRDYEVHYRRVISMTNNTINVGLSSSSIVDPHEVERLVNEGVERRVLLDIPGQARESILRGIQEGHEEGRNPRETAAAIRELVPAGPFPHAGPKYRAELIARTETLHAQRLSSLATYKQSDQVSRVVAFDGTDDEECAARDGEEFSFDEAEAEMNDTHPNCVLAFAPVVA